jgi:TetR/AcrR family acrAB operon transcriptional repressor
MRRTKEEAALTRQAILDAALHIFGSKGYSATRLEDIAQAAGVTRGAVYWHFENKAQLYKTLVTEIGGRGFTDVIDQAIAEGGTYLEVLRRIDVGILDMVERYPHLRAIMELVSYKVGGNIPELAEVFQVQIDIIEGAVQAGADFMQRGIDLGVLRDDLNPKDMAWAWQAFREGVTRLWLMNPEAFSLIEKAPTLVEIFLRGILAPDKR